MERMVIIDVSFPRNVALDVREIGKVELYDIDG
jgi:glutamyl-tRNA reductase